MYLQWSNRITIIMSNSIQAFPVVNKYAIVVNVVHDSNKDRLCNVHNIVILDRSGSMNKQSRRMYSNILPTVFESLEPGISPCVSTIAFDDEIMFFKESTSTMRMRYLPCGGATWMLNAINKLDEILSELTPSSLVRILTVSDGSIFDQEETINRVSELVSSLDQSLCINSQAVRLFTSYQQPDTRGLASVMQLGNNGTSKIVDIDADQSDGKIIGTIIDMFKDDNMNESSLLSSNKGLKLNPWSKECTRLNVSIGQNILWADELPTSITINDQQVKIEVKTESISEIRYIIESRLSYFINKAKILKIVSTDKSNEELNLMMKELTEIDDWINSNSNETYDCTLNSRIRLLKNRIEKRRTSIIHAIRSIVNSEKVDQLNAAQQADFLRKIQVSSNAKALSRRAINSGIDFDSIIVKEVLKMKDHLFEIEDIDDSNHSVSFYSQETSIGGIRALCSFDNSTIEELNAIDVLQIINIVGYAAECTIGDYPDCKYWTPKRVYPGCLISVSDIITAYNQSNGQQLYVPGYNAPITTVIPFFDDKRIGSFMKKYAPNILEYSASIGIRRIIANVPMTNFYTITGGITSLLNDIKLDHSITKKAIKNLIITADNIYDNHSSMNENYSSINSIIIPLYRMIINKNDENIERIARTVYNHNVHIGLRRYLKNHNISFEKFLNEHLLGINLGCDDLEPTNLFELNRDLSVIDKRDQISDLAQDFISKLEYIDNIAHLINFLKSMIDSDYEKVSIEKCFGIDYDMNTFKYLNIYQAIKQSDIDIINRKDIQNDIDKYIQSVYSTEYHRLLNEKKNEENKIVADILVCEMAETDSIDIFIDKLRNGIEYRDVYHSIDNHQSIGLTKLMAKLSTINDNTVPHRIEKLSIIITGRDNDENIIWNNGSAMRINVENFRNIYSRYDAIDEFNRVMSVCRKNMLYIYRESNIPNRHSHCNSKPSFWALGFKSVQEMQNNISKEEYEEYRKIHINCCGFGYNKRKL